MTIVHIKTFGCAHNMADSEVMAHYLAMSDYHVTGLGQVSKEEEDKQLAEADLIIYNTCTVKNPSDDKFFSQLNKTNKPVVLSGCIPQSQKKAEWLEKFSALGVEQLHAVPEVVQETLKGNVVHKLGKSKELPDRTFLPVHRKNKYVAIIPILQGCLGACTYCKTKFARGHLKSYPLDSIITQVRNAKTNGVKEIWIVSEDNGAYGLDIGSDFPSLLRELIKIEGDFKVRIGMFNPEYAYKYRDVLPELMNNDRFYKFLHIPIQAGNNQVLKDMVRPYTVEEYKEAVAALRKGIPGVSIATDIICGFPSENDAQWQDTMQLCKEMAFEVINISKFYPRPGTLAHGMKQLPTEVPKQRSAELTQWWNAQNYNESYVGTEVRAFFSELGKDATVIGKTDNYKQVVVPGGEELLGTWQHATVESVTRDDLRGRVL